MPSANPYSMIRVERDGPVATVTLDRPEKLNALSLALLEEIEAVAHSFRGDAETRAVVFTGAGPHFSAGADLADRDAPRPTTRLAQLDQMRQGPRMLRAVLEMDPITIAAVNGAAAGGGACLATACDFRIGAEDCRIRYPEVPLGMSLSWTALPLCVRLVGPARAKRLVILGRDEGASTLLDWGFLDEVVPADQLLDAAHRMAADYAAMPPLPAQMVKRSVNALAGALDQAVMHMDMEQVMLTHLTEDFAEGVAAWREKRRARFQGR
jgi:enoyl-CoA hydratase/carnithine racemase